jgi:hypothetical protein
MTTRFPDFYRALADDKIRPAMHYAIIEDGKIIATNGKILIYSDLKLFVENPELAEGKVFDKALLQWMTGKGLHGMECTSTGITGYFTDGRVEEKPYTGYYDTYQNTNNVTVRKVCVTSCGNAQEVDGFPDWKSVLPDKTVRKAMADVDCIGLDMNLLKTVAGCFTGENRQLLKMEFYGKGKAVHITPVNDCYNDDGKQEAMLFLHPVA